MSPRMSARTRADGDRTRERILEVALPLFAAHGFAGTSVRTIAGAAGVNVATLAYHFVDKEGLYLTVVQRLHEDLSSDFPALPPAGPPQEVLRQLVGVGWRFCRDHRSHLQLMYRHLLDHGQQPQVVLDRWSGPLMARADLLVSAFRPDWTPVQRRLLVVSMMHLTVRLVLEHPAQLAAMIDVPVERVEDEVVAWLAAMVARELGLG